MSADLTPEQRLAEMLCVVQDHDHGEIARLPDHPEPRFRVSACFASQRVAKGLVEAFKPMGGELKVVRMVDVKAEPARPTPRHVLRMAAVHAEAQAAEKGRGFIGRAVLKSMATWLRQYADQRYPEGS